MANNTGEIIVACSELHKVIVRADNVRCFDALVKSNGQLFTLDVRPYYEMFLEFGIEFKGPLVHQENPL